MFTMDANPVQSLSDDHRFRNRVCLPPKMRGNFGAGGSTQGSIGLI